MNENTNQSFAKVAKSLVIEACSNYLNKLAEIEKEDEEELEKERIKFEERLKEGNSFPSYSFYSVLQKLSLTQGKKNKYESLLNLCYLTNDNVILLNCEDAKFVSHNLNKIN